MKNAVLKNFAIFTEKHLCWSLFLIMLQDFMPTTLSKRDSNIGFSYEYCEIFKNTYFEKHLPMTASIDHKNFYRATESFIEMKYK